MQYRSLRSKKGQKLKCSLFIHEIMHKHRSQRESKMALNHKLTLCGANRDQKQTYLSQGRH